VPHIDLRESISDVDNSGSGHGRKVATLDDIPPVSALQVKPACLRAVGIGSQLGRVEFD
jgi:hypothetical protein